jgi:hypothetical protein
MDLPINPLVEIRGSLGLKGPEFASALGVGTSSLYAAEAGNPGTLPPKICEGLRSLGIDPAQVASRYAAYKREIRAEVLERVRMGASGGRVDDGAH